MFRRSLLVLLPALLALTACGPDLRDGVAEAYATLPERVDFNFHVKPILSDRCYACHGPDAQNRQAGLRLDEPAAAYGKLASGDGFAIVPGKPAKSELVARINSEDPELVMPTPESHLSLSDREIALLTKWVEQGAEYAEHWAFTAPERPEVPEAGEGWARNPIDRFVAAKLKQEGVAPSPEAERAYLIRRVFFDLTGLPPTPTEIDRWETATEADWYETLVDELLARPAYGERMAAYWLDVARFADTEGYLDDFAHEMWPYRDWVIQAYNDNLPYDRFVEWQVAGDQFPEPTREMRLATAFNRNHKQNSEGGIIPEEFRVEYVADRANTVGTAFMGLTVGCARCHDHKYDPISQADYFGLFGFFNSTVERGDAVFGLNALENGRRVANKYAMNAGPTLPLPTAETERIYDHIQGMIREQEEELRKLPDPDENKVPQVRSVERRIAERTVAYASFEANPPAGQPAGQRFSYSNLKPQPGPQGQAVKLGSGKYVMEGDNSRFERSDPFTVSFWVRTEDMQPDALILYNSNSKNQGMRGWEARLDSNRLVVKLSHAYPYQSVALRTASPIDSAEWHHFVWSYDGSSRAAGMRLYRNGEAAETEVLRDHLLRSTLRYVESEPLIYENYAGLVVGSRHYSPAFTDGGVDEPRVLDVEAGDLLARVLYAGAGGAPPDAPTAAETEEYHRLHRSAAHDDVRQELQRWRRRAVETIDTVREIMVMGDHEQLRPTYILDRGVYDAHGKEVLPGVPEALLEWPADLPRNRYGLAKWLTHPDNPLTARVAVNQLWYLMFGRGLVESVEDFGNQGALPTHPALLDWLAVDFRDNGYDIKRSLRQMVTSATYRQSSVVRPELNDRDPNNYWLARAPRYRRSAEMVRDNALAVSGLLDERIGGRSAFPYQPAGLWEEVGSHGFSPSYRVDTTGGLYRRSLYSFWKRNAPNPAALVFDASLRSECQVRRQRSNTPLQALVLLNDPQTLEACRVLAANVLAEEKDPARAAAHVFRRLTGRSPHTDETLLLTNFFEDELAYFHAHPLAAQSYLQTGAHRTDLDAGDVRVAALARVANTVMNSTEGYYKN